MFISDMSVVRNYILSGGLNNSFGFTYIRHTWRLNKLSYCFYWKTFQSTNVKLWRWIYKTQSKQWLQPLISLILTCIEKLVLLLFCIFWLLRKYGSEAVRSGLLLKIVESSVGSLLRRERCTLCCFLEWEPKANKNTDHFQKAPFDNNGVPRGLAVKQIYTSACACAWLLLLPVPFKVEEKYHLLILCCLLVQQIPN